MSEEDIDIWKQTQVLGQGGFGCVFLWQNQETKEHIAIKKFRMKSDTQDKMWERWKMEVYIMGKLNHDNVIRAVEVPAQLKPGSGELPVLAMEFCESGDLRKVLNRPENCWGLQESEIRQLVTGVGSGIEYLHSNRIIHRDLKPENIVLKHVDENRILYKIIDLGYAKELDLTSICDSFVGTVQYLAPELYTSKPYSKTVDYWSFGSLVYECIVGTRPFLPRAPPVDWHAAVCKKSPDDICAQVDENNQIKFSKKLPPTHHLCKPLQGYFEQWLRLMLRWDPKARGGGILQIRDNVRCKAFYLLEQIMALKILYILNVEQNTILSYPVTEEHTISEVKSAIELETGMPADQQDIILANGIKLEPMDLAIQGCCDPNSDTVIVFLFRHGAMQTQKKNKTLPLAVQAIVKEPTILLPHQDHRKAWAQAVHWCVEQNRDYQRLILSHRAALVSLLRTNALVSKQKTQMCTDTGRLMACRDQFQASLDFDIQQYRVTLEAHSSSHILNGIRSEVFQEWTRMAEKVDSFSMLSDRVNSLDEKTTAVTTEIVELQRSPYGKPKQTNELGEFERKAKDLYKDLLKTREGDGSYDMMEHSRMVDLVGNCYLKRDEVTKVLYSHLSKVLECLRRLEAILPDLMMVCDEIDATRKQLITMQCQRQADVWKLLNHSVHVASMVSESGDGSSVSTQSTLTQSLSQGAMGNDTLSMSSSLESIRLMDDCRTNTERLQEMVETMMKDQEESMLYFSSLDSTR